MKGLIEGEGKDIDQYKIAMLYLDWFNTDPPDIGTTTAFAIRCISRIKEEDITMNEVLEDIAETNEESQSNGCLMRTTPLGVFCHKLSDTYIFECTKKDVNLTHSNIITVYAVT